MRRKTNYSHAVRSICENAAHSAEDYQTYVRNCRCLFPTLAMDELKKFDPQKASKFSGRSQQYLGSAQDTKRNASFAYSTWDFTAQTNYSIAEHLNHRSGRLLSLGCPSVQNTYQIKNPESNSVLVDASELRLGTRDNSLHIQCDIAELSGGEFSGAFSNCVFDPPWYLDHYLWWLFIARKSCVEGATIIFPLFGELTRESADEERSTILNACTRLGINFKIVPDLASYLVPSFEAAILERAGIPPISWKTTDIVVGTVIGPPKSITRPKAPARRSIVFQFLVPGNLLEISVDRYAPKTEAMWEEVPGGSKMSSPSLRETGNTASNVFLSDGTRGICNRPLDLVAELSKRQSRGILKIPSMGKLQELVC